MTIYDVIIIGGGPAGLNAAVVLGRCRRKVLLFDGGKQRNRFSHGMHNYLTRDGILPGDFLSIANKEVKKYGVKILHKEIAHAKKISDNIFQARDGKGNIYHSKKMILATGLRDILPAVKGAEECYGKSLFHCPYCDAWEVTNKKIGVYSKTKNGIDLALALTTWSHDITLYTDGKKYLTPKLEEKLQQKNIKIIQQRIQSFEHRNGKLKKIIFKNEEQEKCDAVFFSSGYDVQCNLVESLGCKISKKNVALTNRSQQTNIPGLYVAGDAARDMHFVVVAAAEGAKAGVYINKELLSEIDLRNNTDD